LTFNEEVDQNSIISISYKKDVSLLDAADRINFFYKPTTGMIGNEISQLLDGVEYDGTIYNSIDFGNVQGFDIGGFGALPWDTYDATFQDEIFRLDGSTLTLDLAEPLETGINYNVYYNGIRIDDEAFGGEDSSLILNENATMATIIGDGRTQLQILDFGIVSFADNDVIIIRKETSDGSQIPTQQSYDTALQGGIFESTSATGIDPADVRVDGYEFVSAETSRGPEELVPGQLLDTLDISVYHKSTEGVGAIGTAHYIISEDTDVTAFPLPSVPYSVDAIFVQLDNEILNDTWYEIDWTNKTLSFADSTSSIGSTLSIRTLGTNGNKLLDTGIVTYTGPIETGVRDIADKSAFVSVNGVVLESTQYTLGNIRDNVSIQITADIEENAVVSWAVYEGTLQTYSSITIDNTFDADGDNFYHTFSDPRYSTPFNNESLASNILVKVNDKILTPSYSVNYTITESRTYTIETWAFDNYDNITNDQMIVLLDNKQLDLDLYFFDPVTGIVTLQTPELHIGKLLTINIIQDAEYYFVDSVVTVDSDDDMTQLLTVGEMVDLVSTADSSSIISLRVKALTTDSITFESYSIPLRDAFDREDPSFTITLSATDSTLLTLQTLKYVNSTDLTFAVPPSSGANVEIIMFSNHDVNDFRRFVRTVRQTATVEQIGDTNYYNKTLLTSGVLLLREKTVDSQYAWVMKNGVLLTPNVDYIVNGQLNAVQLYVPPIEGDVIDVLQFGNAPRVPTFGYRIFKDMLNRTHYKRLNSDNSYVLAQGLNYYDNDIVFESTDGLYVPSKTQNIPGVLWLNSERIEYFEIDGNKITQLRRGTLGTGVNNELYPGAIAYGQGPNETINYKDNIVEQKIVATGGNNPAQTFTLNFTPTSADQLEVIVGGRRKSKASIERYDPTLGITSPEADVTIPAEYTVVGNEITFATPPAQGYDEIQGIEIHILYKTGKIFNDSGKTLLESNNDIANFISSARITLPK
jgi:hypothetical protein